MLSLLAGNPTVSGLCSPRCMQAFLASGNSMNDMSFDIVFVGNGHIAVRKRACTVKRECGKVDMVVHKSLDTQGIRTGRRLLSSVNRRAATQIIDQNKSGERL